MAYKRKFNKKRKYAKKRTFKKRRTGGVKAIVRREISRNNENKSFQVYIQAHDIRTANSTSPAFTDSIFPVSPSAGALTVFQGITAGTRIGNQIKIKSCVFKGIIFPKPWNAVTNPTPRPLEIKLWIFYDKTNPTAVPDPRNNFFQLGGATVAMQGVLVDNMSPVNTDTYRVLATKSWKVGYGAYEGTGINANQQAYVNNDFKLNQKFSINLTKHLIQTVKYNDNNSVPTTRGLFAMFQASNADGTVIAPGYNTATMSFTLDLKYEDA